MEGCFRIVIRSYIGSNFQRVGSECLVKSGLGNTRFERSWQVRAGKDAHPTLLATGRNFSVGNGDYLA